MEYRGIRSVAYQIANLARAIRNCHATKNTHWHTLHSEALHKIAKQYLPSGSDIDSGCKIDVEKSSETKIVIHTGFHHMNDIGYYCGWTEHTITVKANLLGLDISISGRDRNDIKDYLNDAFLNALTQPCYARNSDSGKYEYITSYWSGGKATLNRLSSSLNEER